MSRRGRVLRWHTSSNAARILSSITLYVHFPSATLRRARRKTLLLRLLLVYHFRPCLTNYLLGDQHAESHRATAKVAPTILRLRSPSLTTISYTSTGFQRGAGLKYIRGWDVAAPCSVEVRPGEQCARRRSRKEPPAPRCRSSQAIDRQTPGSILPR
jgi:hypothetical protein